MNRIFRQAPWPLLAWCLIAAPWCTGAVGAPGSVKPTPRQVSTAEQIALEPARSALRTLQFDKAVALLTAPGNAGNPEAEYILGLMYLNGAGVMLDPIRGVPLIRSAAERGSAAAAYVLAGELSRTPDAPPGAAQQWLERSAKLGYHRALEALKSGRPLLAGAILGATEPALPSAWGIDCSRNNNNGEWPRRGPSAPALSGVFGHRARSLAACR